MKRILYILIALITSYSYGQYSISGQVFRDDNSNCIKDLTEDGITGIPITIQLQGSPQIFTVHSTTNGEYRFETPIMGTYLVRAMNTNVYQFCPLTPNNTVLLNPNTTQARVNLGTQLTLLCPLIEVKISTPQLALCQEATYQVSYKNIGGLVATNPFIDVELGSLNFISSTIPATLIGTNTLRFNLSAINSGQSGTFNILTEVNCNTISRKKTVCVKAKAKRYNNCLPTLQQPIIEVASECDGDSIQFSIYNNSNFNMSAIQRFWVFEDDVMDRVGTYQLNAQQTKIIKIPTNTGGSTKRLETQQTELTNPNLSLYASLYPSTFVEGCNTTSGINLQNYALQFAPSDEPAWLDIECHEITDTLMLIGKKAVPRGVGLRHFIEKQKPITYTINFPIASNLTPLNTIHIVDTLDTNFNKTSFVFNNTNANLQNYWIDTNFVLHIALRPISSNVNNQQSYVQYSLTLRENTPDSTIIRNKAQITYLNTNSQALTTNITNTTFHTTYEKLKTSQDTVLVSINEGATFEKSNFKISKHETYYHIETPFPNASIKVIDLLGRVCLEHHIRNHSIEVPLTSITTALFYIIIQEKGNQYCFGLTQ